MCICTFTLCFNSYFAQLTFVCYCISEERYLRALYDYSARSADDLNFQKDDILLLIDDS